MFRESLDPGEATQAWEPIMKALRDVDPSIQRYADLYFEGPLSNRNVLSILVNSLDTSNDPVVENCIIHALAWAQVPFDGMPLARYTDRQPGNPHWLPATCKAAPSSEFIAWILEKLNGTWISAPFLFSLASLAPTSVSLPVIERYLEVSPSTVYGAWVICGGRPELERMQAALSTPDYVARDRIYKCIKRLKRRLQDARTQ